MAENMSIQKLAVDKARCDVEKELGAELAAARAEVSSVCKEINALRQSHEAALAAAERTRSAEVADLSKRIQVAERQAAQATSTAEAAVEAETVGNAKRKAKEDEVRRLCKEAHAYGEYQRVEKEVAARLSERDEMQRQKDDATQQQLAEAALTVQRAAEELTGMRISLGIAQKRVADFKGAETKRVEAGGSLTRAQQRIIDAMRTELDDARKTSAEQQSELVQLRAAAANPQQRAAASHPQQQQVAVQPLMNGGRYSVRVLVLLVRMALICKIPERNVPAALDMCFTIFTGQAPTPEYQISKDVLPRALHRLNIIRRRRVAARNAADPNVWSANSDTGNKKDCEREVIAYAHIVISPQDGSPSPVASALSCVDINHDQTGRNGADVLVRQFKLGGLKPEKCAGLIGDSTGHAEVQREGAADQLAQKGARRELIIIAGCIRHFKELELKAAFEGGWPGKQAESFLYAFRDMLHKNTPFWRKVWVRAMQPLQVFNRCIARMPVPTSSKWECMDEACNLFQQTYEVDEGTQGFGVTMIEEFVKYARDILRGHADESRPQDAGRHGDREKFDVLAKDLQTMRLLASVFAVLDLSRTNSGNFHHWCKQPCPLYGWSNDFKAHLMAVRACEEADFWQRAEADPKVAFPLTSSFMKRDIERGFTNLMTSEVRIEIAKSMKVAIEKGKEKNEEWMLKQYTAAPFLFGAVCDERHRLGAAQLILRAAGYGQQLANSMAAAGVQSATAPSGPVQQRLFACIEREVKSGELQVWWQRWGMQAHVHEWLSLATTPAQSYGNPLLCHTHTPGINMALCPLFVLMVHNTRLESYVSKHKQLEQGNMGSRTVNAMFLAHSEMEPERTLLCSHAMRTASGRGTVRPRAREEAAKGHGLASAYESKRQRAMMATLSLADAATISARDLYCRNDNSLAKAIQNAAASDDAVADAVDERKILSFVKTKDRTGLGNARKPLKPVAACRAPNLAKAGERAPKQRGTGRSAADIAARRKAAAAAKESAAAPISKTASKRRDGGRMSKAQHRAQGQPPAPKKRKPSQQELEAELAAKRQRLAEVQAAEAERARAVEQRREAEREQQAHNAEAAAAAEAIAAETALLAQEMGQLKAELRAQMVKTGRKFRQTSNSDWAAMGTGWIAKVQRYMRLKAGLAECGI